ncbi:neural cell adhesion molecule l1 [Plakobranchus ocellatus]|uniref:Neural cell adhesion molecule l1 n=1 Tax=Plakobranchus ocellatus TaxID=259542 RepID=A0AAV4D0I6_9GAST|nr:neural cell adhesion molecule l1 [Plakobranchus ocellatus]
MDSSITGSSPTPGLTRARKSEITNATLDQLVCRTHRRKNPSLDLWHHFVGNIYRSRGSRMTRQIFALQCLWLFVAVTLVYAQDDVRKPPEITKPAKAETQYKHASEAVSLDCLASGVPEPTYKWLRDDQPIKSDEYVSYNSQTGKLTFQSFSRRDEGEYMCVATNRFKGPDGRWQEAASFSPPITMLQVVVSSFKQVNMTTLTGTEYEYLRAPCANKGTIQVPVITHNWYKGVKASQVLMDNGRLFIDNNGDLHFSYLLEKDGEVDKYLCGVSNNKDNILLGNPTKIVVSPSSGSAIQPQFQYSNNGMTAKLFTDATLECFFSGYDPTPVRKIPQIKWFDDASNEITGSSNPSKYSISPDGRKLTIKNIQETDEKNFYCQGVNNAGQTPKQKVFLNIISAPIFFPEGRPKDITRPEHKDAVFNCHARSLQDETPPGKPEWFVNGVRAGSHLDPSKHQFSDDNTKLTISKLSKATDIQCVQCKVSNQYGTIWGDACLNVICK